MFSRNFQASFKRVPRVFKSCFKGFKETFQGVSSKSDGSFKEDLNVFQGYFQEVMEISWLFKVY